MNYSVYTEISVCTHPYDTNTFTHSLTRMYLLELNKVFLKIKKILHLGITEISTLNSYCHIHYNMIILLLSLIKLCAELPSSFLLDSSSKSKIFQNISAYNSFQLFNRL